MFNPLDHPICFTVPGRLCASAWLEHGPFAMFLIDALRPSTLVELGTHQGFSYCAFCQAIQSLNAGTSCFAVDSWNGDQHAGSYGPEIFEELSGYHDRIYGDFSSLLRTTFDEALTQFANGSIDLLHIDGFHSYDAVRHDFESWLPKMSRRGVILFHDTNVRERNFGVWRFWSEIKQRYRSFEFVHGHGLGLLAVGEDVPVGIRSLLEANSEDVARLRRFFSHLGKSLSTRYFVEQLGRDLALSRTREVESEQGAVALRAQLSRRDEEAAALAARVADREWHVESLAATVAERDRQVESLHSVVANREGEVEALTARVASVQEEAAALAARVADREWHVESLAATVAERDSRLESLGSRAADFEAQVQDRDATILDLTARLADHDRCLADLTHQLSERDRWIGCLEADVAQRHEIITRMHAESIEAHGLSEERHREILKLREHVEAVDVQLSLSAANEARLARLDEEQKDQRRRDRLRRALKSLIGLGRADFKSLASRARNRFRVVPSKATRGDLAGARPVPPPMGGVLDGEPAADRPKRPTWTSEVVSRRPEGPMSFQGGKRR